MPEKKHTPLEPVTVSPELVVPAEPKVKESPEEHAVSSPSAAAMEEAAETVDTPGTRTEEGDAEFPERSTDENTRSVVREVGPQPEKEVVAAGPAPEMKTGARAVYEHPLPVRICHWLNTVALVVMSMSGLQIFMAFPSFGPKIPQNNLIHKMPSWLTLGGWLGGALPWHFTFAWIYVTSGIVYVGYQAISGNFRQMLFVPRDIPGVWPMVRHYFLFGPRPVPTEAYNPLQKIAYTSAIFIGAFSLVTGMVLFNPVQFSFLTRLMGGFHRARIWHFASLGMLAFFIFGHLIMVAIHGLNNFLSMLTGWKRDPEYTPANLAKVQAERRSTDG
jgi:thiosulfate reductase cytochrome b subunit